MSVGEKGGGGSGVWGAVFGGGVGVVRDVLLLMYSQKPLLGSQKQKEEYVCEARPNTIHTHHHPNHTGSKRVKSFSTHGCETSYG